MYRLYKKVESFVTESQKRDRRRGVKYDDPPLGKEEIEETKKKIREETQEKMEAYEVTKIKRQNSSILKFYRFLKFRILELFKRV